MAKNGLEGAGGAREAALAGAAAAVAAAEVEAEAGAEGAVEALATAEGQLLTLEQEVPEDGLEGEEAWRSLLEATPAELLELEEARSPRTRHAGTTISSACSMASVGSRGILVARAWASTDSHPEHGSRGLAPPPPVTKIVRGWPKLWPNFRYLIRIFSQSVGPSLAILGQPCASFVRSRSRAGAGGAHRSPPIEQAYL